MSVPEQPDFDKINREAEERATKRRAELEAKAETEAAKQKEKTEFQRSQESFRTGAPTGTTAAPRRPSTLLSADEDPLRQAATIKKKTLLGE